MNQLSTIHAYDFHCHVDLHPDPPAVIRECEEKRIAVLAVTTTPRAWPQNKTWTNGSAFVHAAVGLHPELVGNLYAEANLLEDFISQSQLIGEIGLDGSPQHRPYFEKQEDVFRRALIAANKYGDRLVSIHSRRATANVISLIEQHTTPKHVTCILHWFSGNQTQLRRATEFGCYFSVNEAMLNSDRGRALVRTIPLERLLTETDAPFVTVKGRLIHPANIDKLVQELADLYGTQSTVLQTQIDRNAKTVFSKAGIMLG